MLHTGILQVDGQRLSLGGHAGRDREVGMACSKKRRHCRVVDKVTRV